jgi:hypothetical protein
MLPIVFGVINDKNDSRVDDFLVILGVAMSSSSLLSLTGVEGIGDIGEEGGFGIYPKPVPIPQR